jgi:hypothetical protein
MMIVTTLLNGFAMLAAAGAFGATGGLLKGPGTGTSDSILAHLSTGEFVVNAKATKKHLNLLNDINSGKKMNKFAEGGLVVGTAEVSSTAANVRTGTVNNQVINVNITGDISRQTKSELYRMLPAIAEGVNLHNKEKGYKP